MKTSKNLPVGSKKGMKKSSLVYILLAVGLSLLSSCAIFVGEHHEGRTHGAGVIVK